MGIWKPERLKNTLIDEAREEGEAEGILKVAKNMLQEKMDINLIVKTTGLSKEEILALKENKKNALSAFFIVWNP